MRLKFVLFDLGGNPEKVVADAIQLYKDTESTQPHDWLDDILPMAEDDCVCKAQEVQPTAEALKKYGVEIRNKVSALDVAWMAASKKEEL